MSDLTHLESTSLDRWRMSPANDEARRFFADPLFDDRSWTTVDLPWQAPHRASDSGAKSYLLRSRVGRDVLASEADRRYWLFLDGAFSLAEVWANDRYLGDADLPNIGSDFELPPPPDGADSVVSLEIFEEPTSRSTRQRSFLAGYRPGAHGLGAAGLWRPPTIRSTGPVTIRSASAVCTFADDDRATIEIQATLDSLTPRHVSLTLTAGGTTVVTDRYIAAGQSEFGLAIDVARGPRWWPTDLGRADLKTVTLAVDVDGVPSDRWAQEVGLRRVEWDRGNLRINGRSVFLRGLTIEAGEPRSGSQWAKFIDDAVAVGVNALHVQAHVADPGLYEHADRTGIVVLQGLPFVGRYVRGTQRAAANRAEAVIRRLAGHACLTAWVGRETTNDGARTDLIEPWNRLVFDRSVRSRVHRLDPTRPLVDSTKTGLLSSTPPASPAALYRTLRWRPRRVELVFDAGHLPPHRGLETALVDRLRSLRGHPTGGMFSRLAEPAHVHGPAPFDGGGSVYAPIAVVAELPNGLFVDAPSGAAGADIELAVGSACTVDVFVVNDTDRSLTASLVTAWFRWSEGEHSWRFAGEAPSASVTRIGALQFVGPTRPGTAELTVEVIASSPGGDTAHRRAYRFRFNET